MSGHYEGILQFSCIKLGCLVLMNLCFECTSGKCDEILVMPKCMNLVVTEIICTIKLLAYQNTSIEVIPALASV